MARRQIKTIRIESHIDEFTPEVEERVQQWLNAVGLDASGVVQSIISDIPLVDTGRLLNSINFKTSKKSVTIGTNVTYAKYHEFGTRSLPARHFLKNGATMYLDKYKEMLEEALKG